MPASQIEPSGSARHYYVDEAGDGTLFDRKGRVIIGQEGCSRFFMLGLVDIPNPRQVAEELTALRNELLADPYFAGIPSFQAEQRKTAFAFHAKDDVAEVRWRVFVLLRRHEEISFFAAIKDKRAVLDYVLQRNAGNATYRYNPNELYDYLVRRLFKNMLHKNDAYRIVFSKRGASDRTKALQQALETARKHFTEQYGITSSAEIEVVPDTPANDTGLQVADYFTWALQRLYERREDRYVEYLRKSFRLVQDIDDTREARYGAYYTRKKPLTTAALEGRF